MMLEKIDSQKNHISKIYLERSYLSKLTQKETLKTIKDASQEKKSKLIDNFLLISLLIIFLLLSIAMRIQANAISYSFQVLCSNSFRQILILK
jgi:hypothetical protein